MPIPSSHSTPTCIWRDGLPYSAIFEDIYYSQQDGLQESEYVFLQQNHLAQRWQSLQQDYFTIVETGFGTGLNFLAACQLWLSVSQAHQRLHFVSCEKFPLSWQDLARAHQQWPQLQPYSAALLQSYAYLGKDFHRFHLFDQRVSLTLYVGDIQHMMQQAYVKADAWFLDGFAPAKNPDMWQPALFEWMTRHSKPNASFATFTSAGEVRRGLQQAGFVVEKHAGYGKKRDMLKGYLAPAACQTHLPPAPPSQQKTVAIIGAGLSGLTTAHALSRRGYHCHLIEHQDQVAPAASGNEFGVLYPRPNDGDNPLNALAINSYQYSLAWLDHMALQPDQQSRCGVLQLAANDEQAQRLRSIANKAPDWVQFVDAASASEIAGVDLQHAGLYFSQAGWINPKALCQTLWQNLQDAKQLTSHFYQHALRLQENDTGWTVYDAEQAIVHADIVVLANAYEIQRFAQTSHCKLTPVKGQISYLPTTPALAGLNCVLCGDAYIGPALAGYHHLGATFEPHRSDTEVFAQDHQRNLDTIAPILPQIHASASPIDSLLGRSAVRSCSPDYLPLVGAVAIQEQIPNQSSKPVHQARPIPYLKGLYVHAGHGAKGLLQAPLCAEMIACQITGEPMPVGLTLLAALNPNRQLMKQKGLKKQRQQYQDPWAAS